MVWAGVNKEAKLALLDVLLRLEEPSHVRDILKEGRPHEGFLAVEAGNLRDLINKVEQTGRYVDYLTAHDLEELPEQQTRLHDEINGGDLLSTIIILLTHQKLLHLDVVILAEQLKETEDPAECQLVVELSLYFEFVCLVAEHLDEDVLLAVEVVVGVHDLVREHPLLLVLFELAHFDQEVADVFDEVFEACEGYVLGVCEEFG